ncbi:MAG: hypothetical protein WDZ27_02895 [Waddliaceae bacterium]
MINGVSIYDFGPKIEDINPSRVHNPHRRNLAPSLQDQVFPDHVELKEEEREELQVFEKLAEKYRPQILNHHKDRITAFFFAMISTWGTGHQFSSGPTLAQAESASPLKGVCKKNACHSSLTPTLVVNKRIWCMGSDFYIISNKTNDLPKKINDADQTLEGSEKNAAMRQVAIDIINEGSNKEITPIEGTKKLINKLNEFLLNKDNVVLKLYLEANQLIEAEFQENDFITLLGFKATEGKDRDAIFYNRMRMLQSKHYLQSTIQRKVCDLGYTILKGQKKIAATPKKRAITPKKKVTVKKTTEILLNEAVAFREEAQAFCKNVEFLKKTNAFWNKVEVLNEESSALKSDAIALKEKETVSKEITAYRKRAAAFKKSAIAFKKEVIALKKTAEDSKKEVEILRKHVDAFIKEGTAFKNMFPSQMKDATPKRPNYFDDALIYKLIDSIKKSDRGCLQKLFAIPSKGCFFKKGKLTSLNKRLEELDTRKGVKAVADDISKLMAEQRDRERSLQKELMVELRGEKNLPEEMNFESILKWCREQKVDESALLPEFFYSEELKQKQLKARTPKKS